MEKKRSSEQWQKASEQLRQRLAELEQAEKEWKQVQEALQKSEKRYRDLVENLNEVIYAVNENGVITYISPAIESLIEYTPSEVIGSHFKEFIHQEDLPRLKENFQTILSGRSATNKYRVLTKSGKIRWVHTSSQPTVQGTQVVGVHGVLTNISERKQAEEALARRASQLQIISEVAKKASSILDSNALLSYAVEAIQERFGYYHVDIFLLDQDQSYAVFATSSNPVVKKEWKERNLRFKVGEEGMIGWVGKNGEPLLANDVSQEPHYLPDELLPETKSELVVPLKVEDQTIGVLDVDSNELNAFNEEDVCILGT